MRTHTPARSHHARARGHASARARLGARGGRRAQRDVGGDEKKNAVTLSPRFFLHQKTLTTRLRRPQTPSTLLRSGPDTRAVPLSLPPHTMGAAASAAVHRRRRASPSHAALVKRAALADDACVLEVGWMRKRCVGVSGKRTPRAGGTAVLWGAGPTRGGEADRKGSAPPPHPTQALQTSPDPPAPIAAATPATMVFLLNVV